MKILAKVLKSSVVKQVHHAKVEMQNKELRLSQMELYAEKANLEQRVEVLTSKLQNSEHRLRLSEEQMFMAQRIDNTVSWVRDIETDKISGSAEGFRIFGSPLLLPTAGADGHISGKETDNENIGKSFKILCG